MTKINATIMRAMRIKVGISQKEAASHVGISFQNLSHMELGRRNMSENIATSLINLYHERLTNEFG